MNIPNHQDLPISQKDNNRLCMTIRNTIESMALLNQSVHHFLQRQAISPANVFSTNLALEEMITNIIKYGYDDSLAHDITVTLSRELGRLMIRIEDDGHQFNPLSLPPPDTSPHLEKRKIGGLGIHLVRHTVDCMRYQRQGDRNVLDMIIRLQDADGASPPASDTSPKTGSEK